MEVNNAAMQRGMQRAMANGVSAALRRRISRHMEAGVEPSVRGNRVFLRDIVLVKANGERTPAAAEALSQAAARGVDLNLGFWDTQAATQRRGNNVIAFDRAGRGHTVARRQRGQQVVTRDGRRFYAEAPQTEWIVHLPICYRRTHSNGMQTFFGNRVINITEAWLTAFFGEGSEEHRLNQLTRTRAGADEQGQIQQLLTEWSIVFPPDKLIPGAWEYDQQDPNVVTIVDTPPIGVSIQRTGVAPSGERTVDTLLDQVVFGAPITGFDIWQNAICTRSLAGPTESAASMSLWQAQKRGAGAEMANP